MTSYIRIPASIGPLYATAEGDAITGLYFEGGRHAPAISADWIEDPRDTMLAACAAQVAEYLGGARETFDLSLAPKGTPFQRAVWAVIAKIPHGATITYAELARRAGFPAAVRAAGAATGRNPISIVVPCHRIVGSAGSLTGYAGGLERKARLLALEQGRAGIAA